MTRVRNGRVTVDRMGAMKVTITSRNMTRAAIVQRIGKSFIVVILTGNSPASKPEGTRES